MSQQLERPNQQTVWRVSSLIEKYGLDIPFEVLEVIVAAHEYYIFETSDGRQSLADRLKMEVTQGDSDMEYRVVDTNPPVTVKGKDIFFFGATVVKGMFVRPGDVDAYKLDKDSCDMCGGSFHCIVKTRDEMGKDITICNSCSSRSDLQRIRDYSSGEDGCRRCSVVKCDHHPMKALDTSWITQR
jgi:hypothetical protein